MTKNPWKASMYQSLYSEQYDDLAGRASRLRESVMFKAVDTNTQEGTKYGMGESVPELDVRPVISNLAVDARYRRYGIGSSLLRACEDAVKEWGYDEIVLQVEDDNVNAKAFYEKQGFHILFMDRAARRYDTSGFLLQNVRCTKITLRKVLPRTAGVNSSKSKSSSTYDSSNRGMSGMLSWLTKPFAAAQAQHIASLRAASTLPVWHQQFTSNVLKAIIACRAAAVRSTTIKQKLAVKTAAFDKMMYTRVHCIVVVGIPLAFALASLSYQYIPSYHTNSTSLMLLFHYIHALVDVVSLVNATLYHIQHIQEVSYRFQLLLLAAAVTCYSYNSLSLTAIAWVSMPTSVRVCVLKLDMISFKKFTIS
eukprot:2382-Heterococcus_DN1.PRE.5